MRLKSDPQLYFDFTAPASSQIVQDYEDKYNRISAILDDNPEFLDAVHRERFVTQYDVMEKKIPDCRLPESILERHESTFGELPETLVADKGFCPKPEVMEELRKKVHTVAIRQRLKDYADEEFVALQHFRAGIEGSISVLKRAFGLLRCRYRGFKNFVSHVALAVFSHNLVVLAGAPPP